MRGELVEVTVHVTDCRDPRDNHILELAVSGKADAMISGDQDLLALNPYSSIPIVSTAQFIANADLDRS